jgi:hypothetical protein
MVALSCISTHKHSCPQLRLCTGMVALSRACRFGKQRRLHLLDATVVVHMFVMHAPRPLALAGASCAPRHWQWLGPPVPLAIDRHTNCTLLLPLKVCPTTFSHHHTCSPLPRTAHTFATTPAGWRRSVSCARLGCNTVAWWDRTRKSSRDLQAWPVNVWHSILLICGGLLEHCQARIFLALCAAIQRYFQEIAVSKN